MKSLIFILSCLALTTFAKKETFVGYRLISVTPTLPEHLTFLQEIESNDYKLDFWDPAVELNRGLRVLVSPETYFKYRLILAAKNIKTEVLVQNFQVLIDEQLRSMEKNANNKNIIFRYARYNEIINFIDETVENNPDLASSYVAGTTHENRQLKVIVLKTPTSQRSVWIDCGIHAREWVSPSTCVYTINQLIAEYRANDPVAVALLNKYEVHILPTVNPDGYEYTHNTNRLWRKNRNPNAGSTCVGTDLNRNFDHQWRVSGASSIPCSDTYAGQSKGSELETQAIVNAINAKIGQWDIFLTIHSYSDLWLVPFAYSLTERPTDYNDMLDKALIGAAALEAVHGEKYEVGQASQILYLHSGVSSDWAKAVANIKYAYLLELRPGRNTPEAVFGFTYPEDRMPLVATETYAGLKAIINAL